MLPIWRRMANVAPMKKRHSKRFAKDLLQARLLADLTQAQVAEMLGIGKRTVTRWEAGQATPPKVTQEATILKLINYSQTAGPSR